MQKGLGSAAGVNIGNQMPTESLASKNKNSLLEQIQQNSQIPDSQKQKLAELASNPTGNMDDIGNQMPAGLTHEDGNIKYWKDARQAYEQGRADLRGQWEKQDQARGVANNQSTSNKPPQKGFNPENMVSAGA